MHAAASEHHLDNLQRCVPAWVALVIFSLLTLPAVHAEPMDNICQYQTLEVDPKSGEVHFITPRKAGPEDCSEMGAAVGGMNLEWRQQLPPLVRWQQDSDAMRLCESAHGPLGRRTGLLPGQGCVFLLPQELCTIVTVQALSHAQLANAVRQCVP